MLRYHCLTLQEHNTVFQLSGNYNQSRLSGTIFSSAFMTDRHIVQWRLGLRSVMSSIGQNILKVGFSSLPLYKYLRLQPTCVLTEVGRSDTVVATVY